ncbi:MAG TPA: DNA cytosine methyltransferase, partial [candidate division Zixibacteria bacterium]|nr:DNA cytosine methyltransferase [candidate division Zixibacteria bacterium]
LAGRLDIDPDEILYKEKGCRKQAERALDESKMLELGKNNKKINKAIKETLGSRPGNWVLIGGPPCQAYSVAGRVRNKGVKGYKAESDHRSYLYKEYLKVISKFRPAVFVMENVKGMISAKLDGESVFTKILNDLRCPRRTLQSNDLTTEYEIFSLAKKQKYDHSDEPIIIPNDYIIRTENYGVPQSRHRIILLGIRKDLLSKTKIGTLNLSSTPTIKTVIGDLPKLRCAVTLVADDQESWYQSIQKNIPKLLSQLSQSGMTDVTKCMRNTIRKMSQEKLHRGSNWQIRKRTEYSEKIPPKLRKWYQDPSNWSGICNHESRRHMASDLQRYLFCVCYSKTRNGLKIKTTNFPKMLYADHVNWNSGDFEDRFHVQSTNKPATTITSHLAKDGHYYIHFDPVQCRSLTVREAARIQTFPDNYFFVGTRTEQYVQVGNAVPPYLANQIAKLVYKILLSC